MWTGKPNNHCQNNKPLKLKERPEMVIKYFLNIPAEKRELTLTGKYILCFVIKLLL